MEENKKSKILAAIKEYLIVIITTIIFTYMILFFVQISRVYGTSMLPTYEQGDILLLDCFFYKRGEPEANDIVVVDYHDSNNEETYIIKRVIGVAGDHIEIIDNQLYRNDQLVSEDYIFEEMDTDDISVDIPEGKIFVLGDNRNISLDSRLIGYIDFDEDVVGAVLFQLF